MGGLREERMGEQKAKGGGIGRFELSGTVTEVYDTPDGEPLAVEVEYDQPGVGTVRDRVSIGYMIEMALGKSMPRSGRNRTRVRLTAEIIRR